MGGTISVNIEAGIGSSFIFDVVMDYDNQQRDTSAISSELHGLKVLIVDDNETARDILRNMLESFRLYMKQPRVKMQSVCLRADRFIATADCT